MFQLCMELKFLDITNYNTQNASNMESIFFSCKKLKEIKGTNNLITSKVTNMRGMFNECNKIEYLDLTNLILRM